jgi:hypothetical protein
MPNASANKSRQKRVGRHSFCLERTEHERRGLEATRVPRQTFLSTGNDGPFRASIAVGGQQWISPTPEKLAVL